MKDPQLTNRPQGRPLARRFGRSVAALFVTVTMMLAGASANAYFRYVDENGKLVLSQTIPNDRVKYGYDIVDQYGVLIERVEPQLSNEAYEAKLQREKAQRECERALVRVRRLYQSQDDINYAEVQALQSLETRLSNARANLAVVQNQRKDFEATAAEFDVAGKTIPKLLLDNIERATVQASNLEREIELRDQERLTLRDDFAFERLVFDLDMDQCSNGLPPRADPSMSVSTQ